MGPAVDQVISRSRRHSRADDIIFLSYNTWLREHIHHTALGRRDQKSEYLRDKACQCQGSQQTSVYSLVNSGKLLTCAQMFRRRVTETQWTPHRKPTQQKTQCTWHIHFASNEQFFVTTVAVYQQKNVGTMSSTDYNIIPLKF